MKLLYFAWLREKIGCESEELSLPEEVTTVAELLDWLATRGENYASALEQREVVRVALDMKHVHDPQAELAGVREIALFPPMTGG